MRPPEPCDSGNQVRPPALLHAVAPWVLAGRLLRGTDMLETIRSPRVLIVDDECVIADSLALILNQNGFDATAVYSGEAAVETAVTFNPDVLISDVVMGEMNGIELALRVSVLLPGCRVILISGRSEERR